MANNIDIYLIDGIESFNVIQNRIVQATFHALLAAFLSVVQLFLRLLVAEVLRATVLQVLKIVRFCNTEFRAKFRRSSSAHHVENMIVPLVGTLKAHPRLLQEIMGNVTADYLTFRIEMNLHEFAKARAIVVSFSLRVAKGFQHRIC